MASKSSKEAILTRIEELRSISKTRRRRANQTTEYEFLQLVIKNPNYYLEFSRTINHEIFYSPVAAQLWYQMGKLLKAEEVISLKTVRPAVTDEEEWLKFTLTTPTKDIDFYKNYLYENSRIILGTQLIEDILKNVDSGETKQAIDLTYKLQRTLMEYAPDSDDIVSMQEAMKSWDDFRFKVNQSASGLLGVSTGFPSLDKLTNGLVPGELIIIGARTSVGKSALMMNIYHNITKSAGEETCIIFSLEMDFAPLLNRLISLESGLCLNVLSAPDHLHSPEDKAAIQQARARIQLRADKLSRKQNKSINELHRQVEKHKSKNPSLKVIFIDYLQLMQPSEAKASDNNHTKISEISRGLKLIANELNVAVVALAQLNRASQTYDRPVLSSLKESGSIEQDADVVILLHRLSDNLKQQQPIPWGQRRSSPTQQAVIPREPLVPGSKEEDIDLIVGKNRNGAIGTLHFTHITTHTKFYERRSGNYSEYVEKAKAQAERPARFREVEIEVSDEKDEEDNMEIPF